MANDEDVPAIKDVPNDSEQPQTNGVTNSEQAQTKPVKDSEQTRTKTDEDSEPAQTKAISNSEEAKTETEKDSEETQAEEVNDPKQAQEEIGKDSADVEINELKDQMQTPVKLVLDPKPVQNGIHHDSEGQETKEVDGSKDDQKENGKDNQLKMDQDSLKTAQNSNNFLEDEDEKKEQKQEERVFPATVQVIAVSKEPDGNQAFSVCDGNRYSMTDAFINVGTHVELYSIICIIMVEYEVGLNKKSTRKTKNRDGLLYRDSKFESLLGIATLEVVKNGLKIGHSLYSLQPPLIQDFEPNMNDTQHVNRMEDVKSEDQVKFVFGDQTEIFTHKNNLIDQSSVFERHFAVPDSFKDQHHVEIVDAKPQTFSNLLKFMDKKPFQLGNLQAISDLLYLAEKYLVKDLQTICQKAIHQHLDYTPSSAMDILSLNKTSDQIICSFVFKSIEENIQLL